jgi:hypothetical protein
MIRLNSTLFVLTSFILIVILQMACSTKYKKENSELLSNIADTLNYGKKDYDLMREYLNSDTSFISVITEGISISDTHSMKVKRLLTTEYELRDKIGLTDSEIDALILSYYTNKNIMDRFNEIDQRLLKTDAEAIRAKTDSIVKSIEGIKKESKK